MPAMKKNAGYIGIVQVFDKLIKEIGSPVDFELPESFNKWKPTSYSFIRRTRLEDDGIFCSCSTSTGSSAVCGKDCHCSMLLSSCSSGCKCGSSCLNKPFQQRPMKKLKTVKTEKCGMGVVAEEDISRGDFVIEYVGEVIDDKTCEERLWKMKHRGETNFYLCEINRDMVIDATYKGNKSRYINHSCCPNTQMQKWMIDGETRIGIFATRHIKKGEHLTYDYQYQDCHCGAAGCRKKLGVNKHNKPKTVSSDATLKIVACQVAANSQKMKAVVPNISDALFFRKVYANGVSGVGGSTHDPSQQNGRRRDCIGSVIRIFHSSDKRSFGIIRRFDNTRRKHLVMFEDGNSEFLDLSKIEWEFCQGVRDAKIA
ncbi:Histone-lysine N-methyltransferase ashh3 [Orobanche hederae]